MKKTRFLVLVAVPVSIGAVAMACGDYSSGDPLGTIPASGGSTTTPSGGGSTPAPSGGSSGGQPGNTAPLPCDVLEDAGLPCVSAHSTVRVVVSGYGGPLYQVARPNGMTLDIGTVGGYADAAAQDAFCSAGGCVIKLIHDQSGMGNDLTEAPPGSAKPTPGRPVNAADLPVTINGRSAYGILIRPGMGYRDVTPNGTAVGDAPETMYMVSSQYDLINGCCFDYGNAETTANNDGNGTMEAVYLGMGVIWGTGVEGGPWVMADLENGLYPGWENGQDRNISTNTPLDHDFVTGVVVGDTADKNAGKGRFALYGGDATSGILKTMYDGIRPEKPGYVPMQKQGSIILGIGGDNSNGGAGRFYEGVMANGAATKETVDALQAAIVAAGYGR
jgi:non-reducing end alpha-L-arabinofuranosidase